MSVYADCAGLAGAYGVGTEAVRDGASPPDTVLSTCPPDLGVGRTSWVDLVQADDPSLHPPSQCIQMLIALSTRL